MRNADRVTAALLLAFSVAFAAGALKQYQWWGSGGPGPAFMPFWLGLVMALLALMMLTRSLKEKDPGPSWFPRGEGLRDLLVVLGVTILFVEHNLDAVQRLADRVVAMNLGAKIAEGTPAQATADPAVVKAYLGDEIGDAA